MLPTPNFQLAAAIDAQNALSKNAHERQKEELYNKYYAPIQEADMAYKNALTGRIPYENRLTEEQIRNAPLERAFRQKQIEEANLKLSNPLLNTEEGKLAYMAAHPEQFGGGNAMATGTSPLPVNAIQQQRLAAAARELGMPNAVASAPGNAPAENPFNLVKSAQDAYLANIEAKKALTMQRQQGGANAGVDQKKLINFERQLQRDHPDWSAQKLNDASNAYLSGKTTFSDGEPLPELGGLSRSTIDFINKSRGIAPTPQMKDRSALLGELGNDIHNIGNDYIPSVMKFAGLKGFANAQLEEKKMAAGLPVSEDYRKFDEFRTVHVNAVMDSLRSALKTSVVPEYVRKTLGPIADPNSTVYSDPEQVRRRWEAFEKYVDRKKNYWNKIIQEGRTYTATDDAKDYKEMTGKNAPKYSDADIKHTAQKYNMTEDQVKAQLGIK